MRECVREIERERVCVCICERGRECVCTLDLQHVVCMLFQQLLLVCSSDIAGSKRVGRIHSEVQTHTHTHTHTSYITTLSVCVHSLSVCY